MSSDEAQIQLHRTTHEINVASQVAKLSGAYINQAENLSEKDKGFTTAKFNPTAEVLHDL